CTSPLCGNLFFSYRSFHHFDRLSFPTRRSSDLDEERFIPQRIVQEVRDVVPTDGIVALDNGMYKIWFARNYRTTRANTLLLDNADRKSTRLNSSHVSISYAVFCLKKKSTLI